jgi:hypothetical protein
VNSEIQFLKRTLWHVDNGLALIPGTNIPKVIDGLEAYVEKHVASPSHVTVPSNLKT